VIPIAPAACGSTEQFWMPCQLLAHHAAGDAPVRFLQRWELKPATKENQQRRESLDQLLKSSQLAVGTEFPGGLNAKEYPAPEQQES